MRLSRTLSASVLASAVAVALGCGKGAPPLAEPEPPTVATVKAAPTPYSPTKEFTGRLETKDPVTVVPQVTGKLLTRTFADGDLVKQGQTLFTIEDVLFKADVERARADVEKAKADIANWTAQIERDRAERDRQELLTKSGGATAKADLEKAVASLDVSKAQKKVAESTRDAAVSALAKAEENLRYCTVPAPTTGRVGIAKVAPGALVDAYKTELVRISPLDPIYAVFEVDELTSLWYRDQIFTRKAIPDPRNKDTPLTCTIKLKNESKFDTQDPLRNSTVDYFDPVMERGTGTRTIRATFRNPTGFLSAGDSVQVRVSAGQAREVLAIPEAAVFSQQRKQYVYVVADGKAQLREVELGEAFDGKVEVRSGLTTADAVIADNLLRVRPGVPVTAK